MWGVLCTWLAAVGWHLAANQVVARVGAAWVRPPCTAPLRDVLHTALPRLDVSGLGGEVLHAWSILPAVAAVWQGCGLWWVRVHTLILVVRPLCFLGTLLPDASGVGRRPGVLDVRGGVHDLVFSGHTASALAGACVLSLHADPTRGLASVLLPWAAFVGCLVQSLCILAARQHYTVDVVVAWVMAPLLTHWAYTHGFWL